MQGVIARRREKSKTHRTTNLAKYNVEFPGFKEKLGLSVLMLSSVEEGGGNEHERGNEIELLLRMVLGGGRKNFNFNFEGVWFWKSRTRKEGELWGWKCQD